MGYGVPVSSPIKKVRKPKTGNGMSEHQHLGAWKTNGTLRATTTEWYMQTERENVKFNYNDKWNCFRIIEKIWVRKLFNIENMLAN